MGMIQVDTVAYGSPAFRAVREIRAAVFVTEQGVDPAREFDVLDPAATHFVAFREGEPAGTARLYVDGAGARIGRVAVLPAHRKQGVGEALMLRAIALAREQGVGAIGLHSQVQALPFYEKLGFLAEGDEFMEENIPHVTMRRDLARP